MPPESESPPSPRAAGHILRLRPWGVRVAVAAVSAALLLCCAVVWFAFPANVRESFTVFMRATLLLMGGFLAAIGYALARSRVDLRDDGLVVVNGFRSRFFAWPQVVGVWLRPGSPWAVLDLADGTSTTAMGIQGSEPQRARRHVAVLRAELEARSGEEPPRPPSGTEP